MNIVKKILTEELSRMKQLRVTMINAKFAMYTVAEVEKVTQEIETIEAAIKALNGGRS